MRCGIFALKESRATGIARPALGLLVSQVSSAYLVTRKRKALYRKPRDASEPQQASRHDALDDGAARTSVPHGVFQTLTRLFLSQGVLIIWKDTADAQWIDRRQHQYYI